jgi:hypothetical protein
MEFRLRVTTQNPINIAKVKRKTLDPPQKGGQEVSRAANDRRAADDGPERFRPN